MAINLITVAGTALPDPSEYSCTNVDVVDSGRNAAGVIVSDVIRSDIARIDATWNYLSLAQWASILSLFKSNFTNSVRFLNQVTGTYETRTMYVGDRTTGGAVSSGGKIIGWQQAKLQLIEV